MSKDVVFVPFTEEEQEERMRNNRWKWLLEMVEDTPAYTLIHLMGHQLIGWQAYMFFNVSRGPNSLPSNGGKGTVFKNESHFDPYSAIFTPQQRKLIVITDLGLLTVGAVLFAAGMKIGFGKVFLLHTVPYLWVHHWLGKSSTTQTVQSTKK